jgi:hypothetical protein
LTRIDFVTGAPEKYAHLVESLSTAPQRMADVMRGVTAPQARREVAEGWSINQILAHTLVFASKNGVFIHQMATMTDPARAPFDEDAEVAALSTRETKSLVAEIEREIAKTVELLSRTPDAGWGRPGFIRGGRRSLRQQVKSHADHMHEHIDQIEAMLKAG